MQWMKTAFGIMSDEKINLRYDCQNKTTISMIKIYSFLE